jgi:amino acid transporter
VLVASIFTVVEVGGLLIIVAAAVYAKLPIASALASWPPLEIGALSGVAFGSLLAFFAFIGFEDLANVVEEAKVPHRDIPRAMVLTLLISTVLYILVAAAATSAVSVERLSSSSAPLSLVFMEVTGVSTATISLIAIAATLNTILAQMTMAARVIYGMARQGDLPRALAGVHPWTRTPLVATILMMGLIIALALLFPFASLAEATSLATLGVFALVNLALLQLKYRRVRSTAPHVSVPVWVPVAGFVICAVMIATALLK